MKGSSTVDRSRVELGMPLLVYAVTERVEGRILESYSKLILQLLQETDPFDPRVVPSPRTSLLSKQQLE